MARGAALGIKIAAAGSAAALLLAGPWSGTQFLAHVFDHQAALGSPLARIASFRLYPPFAAAAWSKRWRKTYPKPFAVADLFPLGGLAGAAGLVFWAFPIRGRSAGFGASGWATRADLSRAGLFAQSGAVLGRFGRDILCFNGEGHFLLIGPSRKGKGRSHVVPTLLAWPGSALVLDLKGELCWGDARRGFQGTSGFRALLGPTACFAPARINTLRWNPLFEVRRGEHELGDIQNIVENLVDPGGAGQPADFWDRSARLAITAIVLHVLYAEPAERKSLAVVREKLADIEATAKEMLATLHRRNPHTGVPEVHPEVRTAATSLIGSDERLRSSIRATAESYFGIFADPIVAANTATSDFRLADLACLSRPMTLYLQPSAFDVARLMPLLRFFVTQVGRSLMDSQTHDLSGRPKQHRLLLLLDEFPILGRIPFFERMMGAMAGYGLKAYLVCQSPNHIRQTYGRDNTIVDNCEAVAAFGTSEPMSAEWISALGGKIFDTIEQVNERRPGRLLVKERTITFREEERALVSPKDVQTLPDVEQLIFVQGVKPIRARKLAYDKEPVFSQRLLPAAQNRDGLAGLHDWMDVAPLGWLETDDKGAVRVTATRPKPSGVPSQPQATAREDKDPRQGELPLSNSERASAGLASAARTPDRAAASTQPAQAPSAPAGSPSASPFATSASAPSAGPVSSSPSSSSPSSASPSSPLSLPEGARPAAPPAQGRWVSRRRRQPKV